MSGPNPDALAEARWQGSVDAQLQTISGQLAQIATDKDGSHKLIYERMDRSDGRIDSLESSRDRLLGLAVGVGFGAGAIGGGVGAVMSKLIGG